jgi:CHASE2 domain-containing sensor protein
LENLRPYAESFKAWIASKQKDESQLLVGITLHQALIWAKDKKLSDLDYRFLAASQELAKRRIESDLAAEKRERQIEREKAQFALQAAKQANQILVDARKTARRYAKKIRLGKGWIGSIALLVASLVILVRLTGILQGMELTMLDRFFQARPKAQIDPRITIIAIDEPAIKEMGEYPLSDDMLAQAIQRLKSYKPSSIGLDLYRNFPIEPGSEKLVSLFKTTPNLIGIEKAAGDQIPPPSVLAQLGQVGLADQVLDGDGKLRRALLSVRLDNGELRLNLGLKLALRYLEAQKITPQSDPLTKQMQLGKAVISPFTAWDGGYVRADAGGYQILLNFHGTQEQFQTFSFADLLQNKIPEEKVRDRIVLIGATAESLNDLFQTPYSSRIFDSPKRMPGVTIHANITSQILSAALHGRPMLRVWSKDVECLWILLCSLVGAALSWQMKSLKSLVVIIIIAASGVSVIAYVTFLYGWWIPLVPSTMALVVSAIILPIVTIKHLEKIKLCQTVQLLVAISKEQPAAGQIAIEYLKQAESEENQIYIEQIISDSFEHLYYP